MFVFNWDRFTEDDYKNMLDEKEDFGQVYVGDICIELVVESCGVIDLKNETQECDTILLYNFYVAHENTGYGYKDEGIVNVGGRGMPYDFANGDAMTMPCHDLLYSDFKNKAEELFKQYIVNNDKIHTSNYKTGQIVEYSLVEHANRPLEIW